MRRPKRVPLPHFQTEIGVCHACHHRADDLSRGALGRALSALAGRARRGLKRSPRRSRTATTPCGWPSSTTACWRDIGLNRSDLRDAFALPPWRDPGGLLARRVAERRGSRRRRNRLRAGDNAFPRSCSGRCLHRRYPAELTCRAAIRSWPILPSASRPERRSPLPSSGCCARRPPAGAFFLSVQCRPPLASKRRLHYTMRPGDRSERRRHRCVSSSPCSCWLALAVMPARAQTGFDRPGGDYARFTVPSGDPAGLLGALRSRRALPGLDLLLPGHGRDRRQQCRDVLAEEPGQAAGGEPLLRVGRQGRRAGRDAAGPGRERDRPHRRRLSQLRYPGQPGRPGLQGGLRGREPLPRLDLSCGRATAARRRAATSRTRSRAPKRRPCCMSGVVR